VKTHEYRRLVASYKEIPLPVMVDLITKYTTRTSHVPGDSHTTAFNEGARSTVLFILQMQSEVVKVTDEEETENG
jgi:hypothetical protein